jgi:hypothetical protein
LLATRERYLMCLLTSFVISNIETCFLPPNTRPSLSSALMLRRCFASWRPFRLIYCQSFYVISVRGSGPDPTTAESASSGCIGFMNAAFGVRFFFGADFLVAFFAAFLFVAFFAPDFLALLFFFVAIEDSPEW